MKKIDYKNKAKGLLKKILEQNHKYCRQQIKTTEKGNTNKLIEKR